mgnify:CR=1 FL=1
MRELKRLFQKGQIGGVELKNRIVMSPMGLGFTDEFVNDRFIDFFVTRAKGGAGLIIVSGGFIDPGGKIAALGIYDDKFIPGLGKLTDSVRSHGAKIGFHIVHGGKYSPSALTGGQAVSPSAIFSNWTRETPHELSIPEIKEIIGKFAAAVRRAKEAGFDFVEFNAYSGYLIREFLSPLTNKRTDEYGGDIESRMRFFREIIELTREEVEDFPLICKISGDEFLPGGNTLKEAKFIARELEKFGVNALHVSPGGHETTVPLTPGFVPKAAFVYQAQEVKKEVSIPVITAHIGDLFLAEEVLEEEKADFIAFARAFLADPEFPLKAQEGRLEEIRHCCRCLQGCYDRVFKNQPVTCLVNPNVGKEKEFELKPAVKRKKGLVVGGGPGGMKAAEVLALRGHKVSLFEKQNKLGGQLNFASVAPGKEDFQNITLYLSKQLEKLGVKVYLGKEITPNFVLQEKPDAVIIATGAVPRTLEIPGIDSQKVVTATQVLSGETIAGKKVVVIGGGGIGCEVALFLAKKGAMDVEKAFFLTQWGALDSKTAASLTEKGPREVTILEMLPSIGRDIGITRRAFTRRFISMLGINIITEVEVKEIKDSGVEIVRKDGSRELIEGDTIVVATGTKSENKLFEALKEKVSEIFIIGDAKEPRKALDAIHEGAAIARGI